MLTDTVIEGFSYGRPVVCFDIANGPKTLVHHGYNGLKAKPFDIKELASRIIELIEDETLLKLMGENARSYVSERYSIDKVGAVLEEVLRSAVDRNI